MKDEIQKLKAEIVSLKAEIERLKEANSNEFDWDQWSESITNSSHQFSGHALGVRESNEETTPNLRKHR